MNAGSRTRWPGCEPTQAVTGCRIPAPTSRPSLGEHLDPFVAAHDLGRGEGAGEEEVVGGPALHADPDPVPVDVGRRVRSGPSSGTTYTPSITAYGAVKASSASRSGSIARKPMSATPVVQRLEGLPGRVEADELGLDPESRCDLTSEIDGDARSAPRGCRRRGRRCRG